MIRRLSRMTKTRHSVRAWRPRIQSVTQNGVHWERQGRQWIGTPLAAIASGGVTVPPTGSLLVLTTR
jgi:hypothetical protein